RIRPIVCQDGCRMGGAIDLPEMRPSNEEHQFVPASERNCGGGDRSHHDQANPEKFAHHPPPVGSTKSFENVKQLWLDYSCVSIPLGSHLSAWRRKRSTNSAIFASIRRAAFS